MWNKRAPGPVHGDQMSMTARLLFLLAAFLVATPVSAKEKVPYTVSLQAFRTKNATEPLLAVFFLNPASGWHTYANSHAEYPTVISGTADGAPLTTFYPPATRDLDPLDPTRSVDLYTGQTLFFLPLPATHDAHINVAFSALLCTTTTCQPVKTSLELRLVSPDTLPEAQSQPWWPIFATARAATDPPSGQAVPDTIEKTAPQFQARYFAPGLEVSTLSRAAFLAFLAGIILNFMPCVLPVLTLKLRACIPVVDGQPGRQGKAFCAHNRYFALGIVSYFLALAAIISVTGMVWGQIFQEPSAIIVLTSIVFALSLSLLGVYDLPLIDLKAKPRPHHPRMEAFLTGVLATVLATPCSGPFLGGVLAWALIQPPHIIALVLSCIGLGMATPYLVLAFFPNLYRYMPRPGAWTLHLERVLGLLLAATSIYLLGLLPVTLYPRVLTLLWFIALAAWIWGKWTHLGQSTRRRASIRSLAVLLVAGAGVLLFQPAQQMDPWHNFNQEQFEAALGQENLIVDFTADWCPNCKFLEQTVLTPEKSARLAKEFNAQLLRVDLTRQDPKLMALLESLGARSIPVLAIFPRTRPQSPLVLRDLFTSGQLREALESELRP